MHWFKNTTRRDEVKMLMKGLTLPTPTHCTSTPLPAYREAEAPPPPASPLKMKEVEDTVGKACVRGVQQPPVLKPAPPPPAADPLPAGADDNVGADVTVQSITKSRTTEWRKRKLAEAGVTGPTKKPRKLYCCRVCGQVQNKG